MLKEQHMPESVGEVSKMSAQSTILPKKKLKKRIKIKIKKDLAAPLATTQQMLLCDPRQWRAWQS